MHPEGLFLATAIPAGLIFILVFPATNVYCWDDDVHYRNALSLSFITNVEQTASDRMLINNLYIEDGFTAAASLDRFPTDPETTWDQDQINNLNDELNKNNDRDSVEVENGISTSVLGIRSSFAYLPSAIGLWLGRLFHLPFVACYVLGRLFNLATYCLVSYTAIRITPVKKYLVSTLCLMPTMIFMAANYSYDPWVFSFCMLAFCMFVRSYLDDKYKTSQQYLLSLVALFFGTTPKAIYFPLFGIYFVLAWTSYQKTNSRKIISLAIVAGTVLFLSFILPMLITAPNAILGDARGGSDVNSGNPVSYILNNPLTYAYTMTRFIITEYLPIRSIEDALTNLAYLGSVNHLFPFLTGCISLYLLTIAIIDSGEISERLISWQKCLWSLCIAGSILVLICTSLYVSFTPVGLNTIAGVQPRYLLPLFPLLFFFVFNFKVQNHIDEHKLCVSVISIDAILLYSCIWIFLISRIFF